ncbi:hypothetical protein LVJ94_27740 [Pendulispora rubella]|uniref:DUF5648 domain-containing protein n=1 Tax=Pendulispora rubella TaxID=2741070 RepID=A0ABZ2KUR0_9BACT
MPTITVEMVREMNKRLEARGSAVFIAEREFEGANYDKQMIAHPPDSTVAPLLIDEIVYSNCSTLPQDVKASVDKTITNQVKWYVKAGTKIGWKVGFAVNALFVKASSEFNFEISLEGGKEGTETEAISYKFETPLRIPSMKKVIFQAILQQEKVQDVPFTLHVFLLGGQVGVVPRGLKKLRRYWNGNEHFFTINEEHPEDGGYSEEGSPGYIFETQQPGTVPLYRYWDGGDHFYTTNYGELGDGRGGYTKEGIAGYVYATPENGAVPLYRYYNGKDHHYTSEYNELGEGRWDYVKEGIACYVIPQAVAEAGALRDIASLLPSLSDRTFTLTGNFRGESTVRNASILTFEKELSAEQCAILGGSLQTFAPAPNGEAATAQLAPGFYMQRTNESNRASTEMLTAGQPGVRTVEVSASAVSPPVPMAPPVPAPGPRPSRAGRL